MTKITFSGITIAIFTILVGGYFLVQNQSDVREKYENSILQKALAIKPQLDNIESDVKSPNQPDMAAFQEYTMTVDPATGQVPTDRLITAYKQTKELQSKQNTSRNTNALMEWETSGSNMGGRTRALMFDPNDPDYKKVWAGGVTGGLWYNNDITNTSEEWIPVGDFWSNIAISCITYDPNNPQTFYIGTGEAQTARIIYRASSGVGAGIFMTNDGGTTWELMGSTENFDYITDIAVRDENGISVIYACVASGTYMGEDHESEPSDGVYRSDNAGDTWTQVMPVIPESPTNKPYTPADIEIATNGRIYIGTMENLDLDGGATILYSDNGLQGSWTIYDNYVDSISSDSYYKIPARTLVASSPSDPNTVYAQFAAGYTSGFVYYRGRFMSKSDDGGISWSKVSIPDSDWSTLAWHAFVLKVDPSNPLTVYTGGLDLWKTIDGGTSWKHISDWALMYYGGGDDYVHADQHNIQFQPGSSNTAIFSSDGGVFLTNTANYTYPVFIERNKGYSTLQYYSCAIKPTSSSKHFIGGLQDNGTLYHKNFTLDINDMIDGGDGAYCFWDQDQANIFITSVYYNSYTSWSSDSQADYFGGNTGTFISPADYDYKENILYSNAVGFFGGNQNRLLRAKNIPFNVSTELVNLGTGITVPYSHIAYSVYSPIGTSTLFVGTQSGRLFKVTNAQNVPESIEIGSPDFPTANLSCVAIGESEDNLLVTFSNYGVSSVWLTTDGGTTWEEKESNLPDMPIRWAIIHPDNNGQALLATEIGVWWTNTLNEENTTWETTVDGMANVRVDMLKIRSADNVVLAATHGRGMFTAEYPLDIYVDFEEYQEAPTEFTIYPNPAVSFINIEQNSKFDINLKLSITNISGNVVFREQSIGNPKHKKIDLDHLSAGSYIVKLEYNNKVEYHKLLLR
ncbi:MAG: T9SS type A sorting domain-containing protein [Bacteroidetes bacterium]|nr:T9SS type A sorting domain-containing protein [Bacteroidota bacterium]